MKYLLSKLLAVCQGSVWKGEKKDSEKAWRADNIAEQYSKEQGSDARSS